LCGLRWLPQRSRWPNSDQRPTQGILEFDQGRPRRVVAEDVLALQNNPNVTYVSPNRTLKGAVDVTTQTVGANLAGAWDLTDRSGCGCDR